MTRNPDQRGARIRPGAPVLVLLVAVGLALAGCGGKKKQAATTTPARSGAAATGAKKATCPAAGASGAAIAVERLYPIHRWRLDRSNVADARGCVLLDGKPVAGVHVDVDTYEIPEATRADGAFVYPVDNTVPARYSIRLTGVARARVDGRPATTDEQAALARATSSLNVYFPIADLKTDVRADGKVVVTGRATFADKTPPPKVVLYSYQLSGTVRDAQGRPVAGAVVSTRSVDREIWTLSPPADGRGRYESIFYPSGDADPVGFTVRVAVGDTVYSFRNNELAFFRKLKSAHLDLRLPAKGLLIDIPTPRTYAGAVYEGVLVGVADGDRPIKPVRARWIDLGGRFEFVLPASAQGKRVRFWESQLYAFSRTPAVPGQPVDLGSYPPRLAHDVPRNLLTVTLPQG